MIIVSQFAYHSRPTRFIMSVSPKVGLVTGAARGIGEATSAALLHRGYKVCLVDIDEEALKQTTQAFKTEFQLEKRVTSFTADVTNEVSFRASFDHTVGQFGHLDLVVNNAGILKEGEWERMILTNLAGTIRGTELALGVLGNNGMIVNVGSVSGTDRVLRSRPYSILPVYSASKAGIIAYTRCMAVSKEARERNIRVCCICPDLTLTEMVTNVTEETSRDINTFQSAMEKCPAVRPDVVAERIIELAERKIQNVITVLDPQGNVLEVT